MSYKVLPPLNVKRTDIAVKIISKVCGNGTKMNHFINLKDINQRSKKNYLDAKKGKFTKN